MTYVNVSISLKDLFKIFNVKDFKNLQTIDIRSKGILIKSRDIEKEQDSYELIENLVVKNPVNEHCELVKDDNVLKTSLMHRSFVDGDWVESYKRCDLENGHKIVNSSIDIVDLSVANTQCYYANGQLNHNTTSGGNALKFYASVRIDIRRIAAIKYGDNVIGNRTKVKIVKSKVAPPFKEVEFDIIYNEGISKTADLLDIATRLNLVKKSGAWLTYGEERWQGREQFIKSLKEDPLFFDTLKQVVIEAIAGKEKV